jgi:hypothetical protein
MLHRPADAYAVWVFWKGEARAFDRWYVNFQRPLQRTEDGFESSPPTRRRRSRRMPGASTPNS